MIIVCSYNTNELQFYETNQEYTASFQKDDLKNKQNCIKQVILASKKMT